VIGAPSVLKHSTLRAAALVGEMLGQVVQGKAAKLKFLKRELAGY
jgi:hypothetical protein